MKTPVLFVSHGAPTLPLEPGDTGAAWKALGVKLPRPKAILVISAHWDTPIPTVSTATEPETIHDFYGFPAELYKLQYSAPGAPELAKQVVDLLKRAQIPVQVDDSRGLDHGAWVPLSLMYPKADIPVTQLSLQSAKTPEWHMILGHALSPLRDQGVLIIGSGSISHNLSAIFKHPKGEPAPKWVTEFCDWIAEKIATNDAESLKAYRSNAPHAVQNHPTDEHLLPLFVSLGASDATERAERLNQTMTFGMLAMDIWLFSAKAA